MRELTALGFAPARSSTAMDTSPLRPLFRLPSPTGAGFPTFKPHALPADIRSPHSGEGPSTLRQPGGLMQQPGKALFLLALEDIPFLFFFAFAYCKFVVVTPISETPGCPYTPDFASYCQSLGPWHTNCWQAAWFFVLRDGKRARRPLENQAPDRRAGRRDLNIGELIRCCTSLTSKKQRRAGEKRRPR